MYSHPKHNNRSNLIIIINENCILGAHYSIERWKEILVLVDHLIIWLVRGRYGEGVGQMERVGWPWRARCRVVMYLIFALQYIPTGKMLRYVPVLRREILSNSVSLSKISRKVSRGTCLEIKGNFCEKFNRNQNNATIMYCIKKKVCTYGKVLRVS